MRRRSFWLLCVDRCHGRIAYKIALPTDVIEQFVTPATKTGTQALTPVKGNIECHNYDDFGIDDGAEGA
jgi:hypothetical protein